MPTGADPLQASLPTFWHFLRAGGRDSKLPLMRLTRKSEHFRNATSGPDLHNWSLRGGRYTSMKEAWLESHLALCTLLLLSPPDPLPFSKVSFLLRPRMPSLTASTLCFPALGTALSGPSSRPPACHPEKRPTFSAWPRTQRHWGRLKRTQACGTLSGGITRSVFQRTS